MFEYEAYAGLSDKVEITSDASHCGQGAWLLANGTSISWFAIEISETHAWMLNREIGPHEGQQAIEAAALLVALRLWRQHYWRKRTSLSVRSDNVGVLAVIYSLKGSGDALFFIAKELALDFGHSEYMPRLGAYPRYCKHDVGPAHQPWSVPSLLSNLQEATVPDRNLNWWRVYTYERHLHARQANWVNRGGLVR